MVWMMADAVVTHGTQGEVSTVTTGAISAVVGAVASVAVMYLRSRSKVTVDGAVNVSSDSAREPRVSWTEVRDLKNRLTQVENRVDEIKASQGKNFVMIMESQHASELRVMEKIEKSIAPVHKRIDELLRVLAEGKKQIR